MRASRHGSHERLWQLRLLCCSVQLTCSRTMVLAFDRGMSPLVSKTGSRSPCIRLCDLHVQVCCRCKVPEHSSRGKRAPSSKDEGKCFSQPRARSAPKRAACTGLEELLDRCLAAIATSNPDVTYHKLLDRLHPAQMLLSTSLQLPLRSNDSMTSTMGS